MDELSKPPTETQEALPWIAGALADLDGNIIKYLSPREMARVQRNYGRIEIPGQDDYIKFLHCTFDGVEYPTLIEYEAYRT